jgi:hypothetical protein
MSKKKPAYVDGKFVGDTLSISVKPHYQKEYEFLKSHHNRSGLICELIRQYLEGSELSIGFQKPIQNTQLTQQPKNGIEEVNGGSEGSKENKVKESESKNSQQKEESKKEESSSSQNNDTTSSTKTESTTSKP